MTDWDDEIGRLAPPRNFNRRQLKLFEPPPAEPGGPPLHCGKPARRVSRARAWVCDACGTLLEDKKGGRR